MTQSSPRRIVVTGAHGFIGRHVVAAALADGWEVRAVTRDGRAPYVAAGLEAVVWDAREELDPAILDGMDAVCHLAAYLPPDYASAVYAAQCFDVNTLGTVRLLEAAASAETSSVSIVTSGNAYAPTGERPAREGDALYPNGHAAYYLASKAASDSIADSYRRTRGVPVAIARVSTVYGPGMRGGFLPFCLGRLLRGEPVDLMDQGTHAADWVYVGDIAHALVQIPGASLTGPVNLGGGRTHTIREVAEATAETVGADIRLLRPVGDAKTDTHGFGELDTSRAQRLLAYRPTPLREGIQQLALSLK